MSLTLADYAAAKNLDPAFLVSLGLSEHADQRGPYLRIPYFLADGAEGPVRQRLALDGPNRFKWRAGAKPVLYGLNRLGQARAENFVVLVEGESDCHTLWANGVPALGLPGAAHWNERRDAPHFDGIEKIYVLNEGDCGGDTVEAWLAKSHIRHRAHIVRMAAPAKDPSALYLAAPKTFGQAFQAQLRQAEAWSTIEAARASLEERQAFAVCATLAARPDILDAFRAGLTKAGLVGEDRNAKILYLALTSRFLKKPVSLAYKGPSSGGKSFAVERVLAHFPKDAVVSITSMSEKALIFMEDDLAHKHLVFAEAEGAAGEFQEYLIRSLLSEGRLEHRMADKSEGGIVGRHIVKEGPTGLIVTTTRVRLHPENETRLLSLQANDTPAQTRVVLRAVAARDAGASALAPEWCALQAWLAHGERRVAIPFAGALAGLVSDKAVRMRRDFGAVLSLVQAHALLHRLTRARDADGRIVATLRDYAAVRALVVELIAEGVAATVSKEMRQAVDAVRDLAGDQGAGVQAIAKRLAIDKSSASRRCTAAKLSGYLVNEETQRGRDARYKLGDPLPVDAEVLPLPEDLRDPEGQGQGVCPTPPTIMSPPQMNGEAKPARWSIRI